MESIFKLQPDEAEYVDALLRQIQENAKSDCSVRENMVDFILARSPETSRADAEKLTDRIIGATAHFAQYLEEARRDETGWVEAKLGEATKGMTPAQKYEVMFKLLIALRSLDAKQMEQDLREAGFDPDQKMKERMEASVEISEGDVTQERLDELSRLLAEAIENSTVAVAGNEEIAELIETLAQKNELPEEFAANSWSDAAYKNYAALAAFLAYEQGKTTSIPENIEPETIAVGVAAGIERSKVVAQAQQGKIAWETAKLVLKAIAAAALLCLAFWVAVKVVMGAAVLGAAAFSALLGGSLFAMILGIVLGGYLGYKGVVKLIECGEQIAQGAGKTMEKVSELLVKGYRKASAFFRETAWPAIRTQLHAFRKFIDEKFLQGVVRPKTEQKAESRLDIRLGTL
jgi:hypothetical protein